MSTGQSTVVRLAAGLSGVNLVTQTLGALTHFLLALWLVPADYGVWAAASALTSVLAGLANLGETNRFLAGHLSLRGSLKRSLRVNLGLAAIGLCIAVASIFATGNVELAMLTAGVSLHIPLLGAGNLLYVALVRRRQSGAIVVGQFMAAAARVAAACLTAFLTQSAAAFVVALWVNALVVVVTFGISLHRAPADVDLRMSPDRAATQASRATWAAQAVMAILVTQADYLVLALVADATLLGLYFFAYQATVAVTGVVSSPLSKTALSEFTKVSRAEVAPIAAALMANLFAFAVAGVVIAVAALNWAGDRLTLSEWSPALPVIVILLASVPARLMVPIVDALQLATNQVATNARINALDAVGTGLAALTALTGDVLLVAAAVSTWKVVVCTLRVLVALRGHGTASTRWLTALTPTLFGGFLIASQLAADQAETLLLAAALVPVAVWGWAQLRSARRERKGSRS